MTKKNALSIVEQKIEALRKKRESIFKMDPEKAMEEILDFNESYALVHSFPEQSLYMLMHEAGHEDFLPILSMATKKQWEYIVDLEIWEKNRLIYSMLLTGLEFFIWQTLEGLHNGF